jgi:hypothetical protein
VLSIVAGLLGKVGGDFGVCCFGIELCVCSLFFLL